MYSFGALVFPAASRASFFDKLIKFVEFYDVEKIILHFKARAHNSRRSLFKLRSRFRPNLNYL